MKMITESVWNFLVDEGFRPKDNFDYFVFKYLGKTFIYDKNENDELYFQLILPNIFPVNEENLFEVLKAVNRINTDFKAVKAYVFDDKNVVLRIEILMAEDSDVGPIMERSLDALTNACASFMSEQQN